MHVVNQKPVILSPVYYDHLLKTFDPISNVKKTMATALFNPLSPTQAVRITVNNHDMTDDDVTTMITNCCSTVIDTTAEKNIKELFDKTLVYFDKKAPLLAKEAFAIQAGVQAKLPMPTPAVVYTPATDVIPISKKFLAGQCDEATYFATMAFYTRVESLGFYFASQNTFDEFKKWLSVEISSIASTLPSKTLQQMTDFNMKANLDGLTESLKLRNDDSENNEPGSFARTLITYLMLYTNNISTSEFGVLPFDVNELYCPRSVIFVNVEKHARSNSRQIVDEWSIIKQSLKSSIKMITTNNINKLTSMTRALNKAQSAAANAQSNAQTRATRAKAVQFKKTPPNTIDIAKLIKIILEKMVTVARSQNCYKSTKITYAVANRRDPDDFNKPGRIVSQKYKPDIHIYLDTSGSISERNYQDAIKAFIRMAKVLNVNLYFNSFSDVLSQTTKLNIKDKSNIQIYNEFQKVPKVSGGTDYEQIWNFININQKRKRELSLIVTDMEYSAPSHYVEHPKNLYYIACSNMDWKRILRHASRFCDTMSHIDPNCRSRLLF